MLITFPPGGNRLHTFELILTVLSIFALLGAALSILNGCGLCCKGIDHKHLKLFITVIMTGTKQYKGI